MISIQQRRAISPAITTLILLGIAVASGVSVFAVVNSISNVSAVKSSIMIENMNLVKTSTGEEYLSVTLKNIGNKILATTAINLQVDTNLGVLGLQAFSTLPSPTSIQPGQTASVYTRINYSNGTAMINHNVGDVIAIEAVGTTPDGSTTRIPTSVIVRFA